MSALADTNAPTSDGHSGSPQPQQPSMSTDAQQTETTLGASSNAVQNRLDSSSRTESNAQTLQKDSTIGLYSTKVASATPEQAGTVSAHQIPATKVQTRRQRQGKIAAAFRSTQKWISRQNWWPWEIGYWLCSLAFLFAIIAILAVFDGKTIPQWKFGITVNTLVSVFGTINILLLSIIVGACIGQVKWIWFRGQARPLEDFDLIDEAGKGPAGSIALLLQWRGGLLAIIGACLTILILAIGPFVQQIIAFENRPVSELTASLPVARNYAPGHDLGQQTLMVDLKAAVLNGAVTTSPIEYKNIPSCATGNCTWTNYQSLAVCSACAAVNDTEIGNLLGVNKATLTILEEVGGLYVIPFWDPLLPQTGPSGEYTEKAPPTLAFQDHGILIADVFLMAASKTFECILDFCVKTYNASIERGNFVESEINSIHQRGPTTMIMGYNEDSALANAYLNFPPDTVVGSHYIEPDEAYYLSQYINSTFWGFLAQAPDNGANAESSLTFSNDVVEAIYTIMEEYDQPTPDIIFENTAQSLTKVIRANAHQSDGSRDTLAMGDALHNETFISVRWLWLILPAAVQILVLAFLAAIIYTTRRAGLEAYKDGVLPALFQGIDEESRNQIGRLTLLSDMDEVAENTKMMLVDLPSAGWSLSSVVTQSTGKASRYD